MVASRQFVRRTHTRNVPGPSSPRRPSTGGSVLSGGRSVNGLFDVDEERTPTTRLGKLARVGEVGYRYVFGGVLLLVMGGASLMILEYYFWNPEKEVRARTTRLLQQHPVAIRALGGTHMVDVTERVMGSRAMQAFHRFPYVGTHPIEMQYALQGRNGKAFVMVQWIRSGDMWTPVYLHLDTNHGRTLLLDTRARQ